MSFVWKKSKELYEKAQSLIPGGVNSPVRAFKNVDGTPLYIEKAHGAYLYDADDNKYVDYISSWGPAILGHADSRVLDEVKKSLDLGISFGACNSKEIEMAELLKSALPSMEKVRLVSSGTEACMAALRLARAYTKRDKILKFSGCYHGHADMLLVKGGSGMATFGVPDSPGVPKQLAELTLTCTYNNSEELRKIFEANKDEIAAVIIEPIVGNSGFIRPKSGFLQELREICTKENTLLIFDEVMTGFRVGWGGVQTLQKIKPDLTTLGKVIGGGMPMAAYGGKKEIMDLLSPLGPVYQAGTLSGHPVALTCGLKTLKILRDNPESYVRLSHLCNQLIQGMADVCKSKSIPFKGDFQGGMFGFFFSKETIYCYEDAKEHQNTELFKKFFWHMLERGFYFAPSAYEACFLSLSHTDEIIQSTIKEFHQFIQKL